MVWRSAGETDPGLTLGDAQPPELGGLGGSAKASARSTAAGPGAPREARAGPARRMA